MSEPEGVKTEHELKVYLDVIRRDIYDLFVREMKDPRPEGSILLELTKILNKFWRFTLPTVKMPTQDSALPVCQELTIDKDKGLSMLYERFPGLKDLREQFCFWPAEKPNVLGGAVPIGLAGWMAPEVKATLTAFSAYRQPAVWLELGTWLGLSARNILDAAPGSIVIAVDDWTTGVVHPQTVAYMPRLFDIFCDECWEYRDHLLPVRLKTIEGMQLVHERGIRPDFVFIDADHSYQAVKNDFLMALDLFPSAIIIGDDYCQPDSPTFGVARAVNDLVAIRGLSLKQSGSAWWVDRTEAVK